MSVYAIIGLVVVAAALFLAFRPRKRGKPGAENNWTNATHLGAGTSGVAPPGDFSATQDGGAAAYGDGGGTD
jgi:hypothetical protein